MKTAFHKNNLLYEFLLLVKNAIKVKEIWLV